MNRFLWVLTLLGCIVGALIDVAGVVLAKGAPQEASAAAIAVACAVIPYCLARAAGELDRSNTRKCPYCAENIREEAERCKFFTNELPDRENLLHEVVNCPACKVELYLRVKERIEWKFVCDSCEKRINMSEGESKLEEGKQAI